MIDLGLTLALSLHSAPRTMAVLLGSGISRSAGIPTGWEIVLDLVQKLARLEKEKCDPAPEKWYIQKYGSAPDYAKLLSAVAKTPAARQALLRGYFEPNEEERAEGLKAPTTAHKAIAQLVRMDFIRVIVTTNFDRLMEKALEDEGIVPSVIATSDALNGALPLTHSRCTVIKVHGDYLDSRIRNTPDELAQYDQQLNSLLDRVFSEYGMIVSGWSADYDTALRAAITRHINGRFPWYWTIRGTCSGAAQQLINHTKSTTVSISDADTFFSSLVEKIQSLNDMAGQITLPVKMAQATLKRIMLDPMQEPRVHDLMNTQINEAIGVLTSSGLEDVRGLPPTEEVMRRINIIETAALPLMTLYATAGHWGVTKPSVWNTGFQRLLSLLRRSGGTVYLMQLQRYIATLVLYAAGLGGIASGDLRLLAQLMQNETDVDYSVYGFSKGPVVLDLMPASTLHRDITGHLPNPDRNSNIMSARVAQVLREPLRDFLPTDELFFHAFDRLEYLLGLLCLDAVPNAMGAPLGNYIWRSRSDKFDVVEDADQNAEKQGVNWAPLKAGFFGGSIERYEGAAQRMKAYLERISASMGGMRAFM